MRRLLDERAVTESCTGFEISMPLFIATRMALMAAALIALLVADHQLETEVRNRVIEFSDEFEQVFGSSEPDPAPTEP